MTSLALRALHFTLDTHWAEVIFVPQITVNRLAMWLCKKQYAEGYWVEESIIYDRNMKVRFNQWTKLLLLSLILCFKSFWEFEVNSADTLLRKTFHLYLAISFSAIQ